jgi:hypothetical protein
MHAHTGRKWGFINGASKTIRGQGISADKLHIMRGGMMLHMAVLTGFCKIQAQPDTWQGQSSQNCWMLKDVKSGVTKSI